MENIWFAAVFYFPGLINIKYRRPHTVNHAIAGSPHTMENQKPSLIRFNRDWPRANLCPCKTLGSHNKAVESPVFHISALAQIHIAKRCMPVVGRPGKHHVFAVDFARKKHAVAVKWQEGIFQLIEFFKIIGVCHPDRRTVIIVAPGHIVPLIDTADTGIITARHAYLLVILTIQRHRGWLDIPVDRITAFCEKQMLLHRHIITAEDTYKMSVLRDDRTVKDTVRTRNLIPFYNRIPAVTPYNLLVPGEALLPRDIG